MRIDAALTWATSQLEEGESPSIDAKALLCYVLDKPHSFLFTWPEIQLTANQLTQYQGLIEQRQQGHPVAHLTGSRDFWTLSLSTSPHTLIPRPDTEILVEQALLHMRDIHVDSAMKICDLGTGTGAIALALASELPQAEVVGVDFLDEAIALAKQNAQRNKVTNARFLKSSWFGALCGEKFHAIVSNPPYIEESSPFLTQGDVRFEPASALTSGHDGLDDIKCIIDEAPDFLYEGGLLAFEHGFAQADAVQQLMKVKGFTKLQSVKDFGNNDRVTLGYWQTC